MPKEAVNMTIYMSLLIGINDVWHEISKNNGVCAERFEVLLKMLIEDVIAVLPEIKIMLLEPFVLNAQATQEYYDIFRSQTLLRADIVKRVSEKYGLVFVPLQDKFDELAALTEPSEWLSDGVHPTVAGHEVIAREWIKAFNVI